jgi:hypothetical protein
VSDFFEKDPSELLEESTVDKQNKLDMIKQLIAEDFEEEGDGIIYPSPIQPKWKN